MPRDEDDVTERLSRLERENRRMRGAVALIVLFAAAGVVMAQDRMERDVMSAQQFVLQDKAGKRRAWWGVNDKNETTLVLDGRDEKKPRIVIASTPDGQAKLLLCDADGRNRMSLLVESDGSAQMGAYDERGTQRMWLKMATTGQPRIGLLDEAGQAVAELVSDGTAPAALVLRDAGARDRLRLDVGKDGLPSLSLSEATGKVVARLASEKESPASLVLFDAQFERMRVELRKGNAPAITLFDDAAHSRASIAVDGKGAPAVELFDQHGAKVFKAPAK